jgi:DNA polymerase-3 subunit delta'
MFDQLTGNESVKQTLRKMLESGRLPGALLFTGVDGIGKKLFALEVAKALNCRTPNGFEACGNCPACVRIARLHYHESDDVDDWDNVIWTDHPDVGMVIAPKRVLKVDQMRRIEREANFRPFEGRARVFLIDEADRLNDASANALLKVLEEPPPTSHLILITSRPAMLLPTIRSRCQMIRFSPLLPSEIEQHLIVNKLASPAEASIRARVAGGSLSRALESDVAQFTNQRKAMLKVLRALTVSEDRAQLLRSAEELNEARFKDEYEPRLEILETLIRDAWAISHGVVQSQIVNGDLLSELGQIAERMNSERASQWITQIEELREQLAVNINRKIATDALFMAMASV